MAGRERGSHAKQGGRGRRPALNGERSLMRGSLRVKLPSVTRFPKNPAAIGRRGEGISVSV